MSMVAVPASTVGKRRALVIEDSAHMAYLLEFMLRREGFETITCPNGRDARAAIANIRPVDVVLLDLMLPYVSGYQLIEDIRADPAWQHVPVIVVSGKVLEQDVVRALDLGANDYVTKPIRPPELLARVRRAVGDREEAGMMR